MVKLNLYAFYIFYSNHPHINNDLLANHSSNGATTSDEDPGTAAGVLTVEQATTAMSWRILNSNKLYCSY